MGRIGEWVREAFWFAVVAAFAGVEAVLERLCGGGEPDFANMPCGIFADRKCGNCEYRYGHVCYYDGTDLWEETR